MNGIITGVILAGGVSLCIAGFSNKGLPLNDTRRITGKAARCVGVAALVASLIAAVVWNTVAAGLR